MNDAERMALLEARVGALFSLLACAFRVMMSKGVLADHELAATFDQCSATMQRIGLQAADLTPDAQLDIDAHLAEIGRLRQHLGV